MNNEMQQLKKTLSFVQKTQKYIIILLIFPFLSSGEQSGLQDMRNQESAYTFEKTSDLLRSHCNQATKHGTSPEDVVAVGFYEVNRYRPVWSTAFTPNENAEMLTHLIGNANRYGLFPEQLDYNALLQATKKLSGETQADQLLRLRTDYEVRMTSAAIKFIAQLNRGLVQTDSMFSHRNMYEQPFKHFQYHLMESLQSGDFKSMLLKAQPRSFYYHNLQAGLEKWLTRIELSTDSIKIDDNNAIPSVNQALIRHGYTTQQESLDSAQISEILKSFQHNTGIEATGWINQKTKDALQKSTFDYFLQIAVNMERLKNNQLPWKPTYVFVNIPSFEVKIINYGKTDKTFKAVVGKPYTPTPEITSKIEQIVTCPKWYVPRSIATREILYHMKKDSSYLEKRNFTLLDKGYNKVDHNELDWNNVNAFNFDYKIMQQPGRSNALGTIKFLFPNEYSVYLHDTPAKQYFNRSSRAYSHGCVRLDRPEEFADYLIQELNEDSVAGSVKTLIGNGQTKEIRLQKPVDIAIRYFTCATDDNNNLVFLNDLYKKDIPMIEQILN